VELRDPSRLKTPIPPSNPRILRTHNEIWNQNKVRLILDVWWFNIPGPVELSGPPCLETPIPPSYPQILNNHKEIYDHNEVGLILDVWWFNMPAPVELSGPPAWKSQFHLPTLKFSTPT
jgi:hypothetical protein